MWKTNLVLLLSFITAMNESWLGWVLFLYVRMFVFATSEKIYLGQYFYWHELGISLLDSLFDFLTTEPLTAPIHIGRSRTDTSEMFVKSRQGSPI